MFGFPHNPPKRDAPASYASLLSVIEAIRLFTLDETNARGINNKLNSIDSWMAFEKYLKYLVSEVMMAIAAAMSKVVSKDFAPSDRSEAGATISPKAVKHNSHKK